MKAKVAFAAVLMLAVAFSCVGFDTDDGTINVTTDNQVTFDPLNGGIITLKYVSDETKTVSVKATVASSGEIWYDGKITFSSTAGNTDEAYLVIPYTSNKAEVLNITFTGADIAPLNVTVKFSSGLWGSWTTYAAIAFVIILLVALVFFRSRTPKAKNTMTFEELEAQKKAEKVNPQPAKQQTAPKTERQRYLASKKK